MSSAQLFAILGPLEYFGSTGVRFDPPNKVEVVRGIVKVQLGFST